MNKGNYSLSLDSLLIIILPLTVIGLSFLLVAAFGQPYGSLAQALVENGHAEAAGRLKVLATWLLLLVVGTACIGYFAFGFGLFEPRSRVRLAISYIVLALIGCVAIYLGMAEGPRLIGTTPICNAFSLVKNPPVRAERPAAPAKTETAQPPNRVVKQPAECDTWHYSLMGWLNLVQRYFLALISPALVLGAISCLGKPAIATRADCRFQAKRLNTTLYLTATLFVSGLLFLSALLHWPEYAFKPESGYSAHVDAFVLYWGVTYSLFIASYYVPVALRLTRTMEGAIGSDDPADRVEPDETPAARLFGLLKTGAALFAPAIAGLLGSGLKL